MQIGQKIRRIPNREENTHGRSIRESKVGTVYSVTNRLIVIKYENGTKESFNINDLICPKDYKLEMRVGGEWREVTVNKAEEGEKGIWTIQ